MYSPGTDTALTTKPPRSSGSTFECLKIRVQNLTEAERRYMTQNLSAITVIGIGEECEMTQPGWHPDPEVCQTSCDGGTVDSGRLRRTQSRQIRMWSRRRRLVSRRRTGAATSHRRLGWFWRSRPRGLSDLWRYRAAIQKTAAQVPCRRDFGCHLHACHDIEGARDAPSISNLSQLRHCPVACETR